MTPEIIADYACNTGEGPLWHSREKCVYWVDIPNGRLFRYDPATGQHGIAFETDEAIGGFTEQADGSLLLFLARGAVKVWQDGKFVKTIIEEIPDERETRFNDVFPDTKGRVFCGTMPTKERLGRLYRLETDGTLNLLLEGIGTSNGMGFTPDRRQLYYTDTRKREIYLFDYDEETGAITNQRVFARVPQNEGEGGPDGMTVDAEGYVWSARWGGSCVVRYAPDGTEVQRVMFPGVRKVSSITFGGADYRDAYVTTAGGQMKNEDGENAGALFRVDLGVQGVPEFHSRIGL